LKIITKIVAAEEDEVAGVGESVSPLDEWSGIEWHGLDSEKVVMLHCLLTGDEFGYALSVYEPVYVGDGGAIVVRVAGEVLDLLGALEGDALEALANELAATETFESEAWDAADVRSLLTDLADLARLAESQGQVLYVWMRPLSGQVGGRRYDN